MNITLKNGKYIIDGQTYDDFQNIPLEIRQKYLLEDKDGNGISDNFDDFHRRMDNLIDSGMLKTTIEINGKKYENWDDVPPELQEQKQSLQAFLEKSRNKWGGSKDSISNPPSSSSSGSSFNIDTPENKWKFLVIFLLAVFLVYIIFADQIKSLIFG